MKKITIKWRQKKIKAMSHPGCCGQNGGCTKKHG